MTRKATSTLVSVDESMPFAVELTACVETGGISTLAHKSHLWAMNNTWVLEGATAPSSGLTARSDHGFHWSIEPSTVMSFETYKGHLTELNSKAVRYDTFKHRSSEESVPESSALKGQSTHPDRATRFVYDAFVTVVQKRTPVEGWDENDYAYIAELAHALENGTLPLSALIWCEEAGWSKERVFAADAITAHIAQEEERGRMSEDDDVQADIDNDNAYLRVIFNLDDAQNPFVRAV